MAFLGIFLLLCAVQTIQASSPSYVVEVYFVVDRKVVELYMSFSSESSGSNEAAAKAAIEKDADYFVKEISDMFGTADNYGGDGVKIEIRKRKLDILDSDIFKKTVKGTVNSYDSIHDFDDWLVEQNAHANINYDVAVLWTGFDLENDGIKTRAGFAYTGTVCEQHATAVVENDGTCQVLPRTAHELGHVLGANHDPNMLDKFVMSSLQDISSPNRWTFSMTSASDMKTKIEALTDNCLLKTDPSSVTSTARVPNELADPDTVCQRKFGTSSYLCLDPYLEGYYPPKGDDMCKVLRCLDPKDAEFRLFAASSDGLPCGTNMRCNDGKCQADDIGGTENLKSDCLYGDQDSIELEIGGKTFQGSCSELISSHGKDMCFTEPVFYLCCSSCAASGADKSCLDPVLYQIRFNGVLFEGTCSELIAKKGKHVCTYDTVRRSCCATCSKI